MKKLVSLGLAVLLLLSCLTIVPFAEGETPATTDFVITPSNLNGAVVIPADGTGNVLTTENKAGHYAFKIVPDASATRKENQMNCAIDIKNLKLSLANYKWVTFEYYVADLGGADTARPAVSPYFQVISTEAKDGVWTYNYQPNGTADKPKVTLGGESTDTSVNTKIQTGVWCTLSVPVDMTKLTEADVMTAIRLSTLGNVFFQNNCPNTEVYVSAIVFSKESKADLNGVAEGEKTIEDTPKTENYTAEDYTVPNTAFFGGVPGTTVTQQATFEGKDVIKLTKGTGLGSSDNWNDAANDWPITVLGEDQSKGYGEEALTDPINVRLGDYKYIVVKCYYDLNTLEWPTSKVPSLQLKQVDDAKPWKSFTAKSVASSGALANAVVREDKWQYFVFDMTDATFTSLVELDTTKYPNGFDSQIKSIQLYMFANGGILNGALGDDDTVYIEYFTFTNDYQALLSADKGNESTGGDSGNDSGNNGNNNGNNGDNVTTAAPETNAPETNAPATTAAPAAQESGCASAIGTSTIMLAMIGMAGALAVGKKKKK